MFGMTESQAENAVGHNYQRLLRKAGKGYNASIVFFTHRPAILIETRKNTILAAISINRPDDMPVSSSTKPLPAQPATNQQQKRKQKNKDNNKQQKKPKTQSHATTS
jgi:hypothetical protein